jgi:hypothetical protein
MKNAPAIEVTEAIEFVRVSCWEISSQLYSARKE